MFIFIVKSPFSLNSNYQLQVGKEVIAIDATYFRPTEVELLIGDASKAYNKLGWKPEYKLQDLINDMMKNDLELMTNINI